MLTRLIACKLCLTINDDSDTLGNKQITFIHHHFIYNKAKCIKCLPHFCSTNTIMKLMGFCLIYIIEISMCISKMFKIVVYYFKF